MASPWLRWLRFVPLKLHIIVPVLVVGSSKAASDALGVELPGWGWWLVFLGGGVLGIWLQVTKRRAVGEVRRQLGGSKRGDSAR
jgi:hypothetical protein